MRTKKNFLNVLYAVGAAVICVLIYKLLARHIHGFFSNDFVGSFMAQLFFALLATAACMILRMTDTFETDWSYLKKGWTAAGLEYALILLYSFLGLVNLMDSTAKWWEFLLLFGQALLVGYCEELLFRGMIQRSLHKYVGERNWLDVLLVCIISGLLFGAAHISNATSTGWGAALYQAAITGLTGIYLGAVYWRNGKNVWFMMLLHAVYDMVGFIMAGRLSGGTVAAATQHASTNGVRGFFTWFVLYGAATIIVLRPKKVNEVLAQSIAK